MGPSVGPAPPRWTPGAGPPVARREHLGLPQDCLDLVPLDEKGVVTRR
jgi:hypothetical protein